MAPPRRFPPTTLPTPKRLQSVDHLRIRRPNKEDAVACLTEMSSVLSCWASSNYSISGCAEVEQQLMRCADRPKNAKPTKNSINYHLGRLYPKIQGPKKKEGSLR